MTHNESSRTIAVLMGPTGSGKSAMAMAIAKSRPTVIINADAMQMVSTLRVLTARPTVEEEQQAEHALYGVLSPEEPTSVARWLSLVEPIITHAHAVGKLPLLVGGTGMYVKALMEGLAKIPPIPEPIRQKYRAMAPADLYPALVARDPVMASKLKPGDTQRLIRALEVVDATGTSLDAWQKTSASPLFAHAQYRCFYMNMPREEVYARINQRFHGMMARGALAEVEALLAMTPDLPPANVPIRDWCLTKPPIYRAHGVPELMAYVRGEITREEAIAKAQQNTRNYAKRQLTWIRNQLPQAKPIQHFQELAGL